MREESSVALNRLIDEPHFGITYLEEVEEELQKTKKELERERTIREHYESVLLKYPVKEEKEEFKRVENVFPYVLWGEGFTRYGAGEKGMMIHMPIADIGRDVFAFPDVFAVPKLLSRQRVESEIESSASSQKLSSIFSTTLRSQALTATASVATIISLFALYYGFLYGYWAIVWCGFMTLGIIFVDMWIVASRERKRHERR